MKMEFSAGGVLLKREHGKIYVALILDSYGKWTFPKGHIEKGEKPENAALREVAEEIGANKVELGPKIAKIDYWFKFNDELFHKYVYYYLMTATENCILKTQITEIQQAEWIEFSNIENYLSYKDDLTKLLPKIKQLIEDKNWSKK